MYIPAEIGKIFKKIYPASIMGGVFSDPQIQEELINAITLRLEKKGETSSGIKLATDSAKEQNEGKVYSVFNTEKSNYVNVDLNDTGKFYSSFEVSPQKSGFEIKADFEKQGNHIADNFTYDFSEKEFESEIISPIIDEYFVDFTTEEVIPAFFEALEEILIKMLNSVK